MDEELRKTLMKDHPKKMMAYEAAKAKFVEAVESITSTDKKTIQEKISTLDEFVKGMKPR